MPRSGTVTEFVEDARQALLRCGFNVMFVTFECTCWGAGPARWKFAVQLYETGRLICFHDPDADTVLDQARTWLRDLVKAKAA